MFSHVVNGFLSRLWLIYFSVLADVNGIEDGDSVVTCCTILKLELRVELFFTG